MYILQVALLFRNAFFQYIGIFFNYSNILSRICNGSDNTQNFILIDFINETIKTMESLT